MIGKSGDSYQPNLVSSLYDACVFITRVKYDNITHSNQIFPRGRPSFLRNRRIYYQTLNKCAFVCATVCKEIACRKTFCATSSGAR